MTLDSNPVRVHAPTLLSAKGSSAMGVGDVRLARECHLAAARALTGEMAAVHPAKGRHPLRFQVATQYFKAGEYAKAKRLAAGIDPAFLPPGLRPVFELFWQDCLSRTRPGYADGIRKAILACYPGGTWKRALELLAAHPYVISPSGMAFMRGVCLENLGKFRVAARWFGRAFADPHLLPGVLSAANAPDRLVTAGRWEEAEAYARALADAVPHPFVIAAASFVFYRWIHRPDLDNEVRRRYAREQLDFLGRIAGAEFSLPNSTPDHRAFFGVLAVALAAGADTLTLGGQHDGARELLVEASRLDPEVGQVAWGELRKREAERVRRPTTAELTGAAESAGELPHEQSNSQKQTSLLDMFVSQMKSRRPNTVGQDRTTWTWLADPKSRSPQSAAHTLAVQAGDLSA